MAASSRRSVIAATAATATLCASPLFVAPTSPSSLKRENFAKVPIADVASSSSTISSPTTIGAGVQAIAVAGCVAASLARRQRNSRVCRSAEAAAVAAVAAVAVEEEQAPPPPPKFDPTKQFGVSEPLGFFDPLNFCEDISEEDFRAYRRAEIKHGRVAMMACAGAVVQHFYRFGPFEDAQTGIYAVVTDPSVWGSFFLVLFAGVLEAIIWLEPEARLADQPEIAMSLQPGDFGDPLGLAGFDRDTRNKELNNGRFAMFAAIGIIAAEINTKKDAVEQLMFWT